MAIIQTVNDSGAFYHWMQQSDNYRDSFSYEGARAVQKYFEELSDEMGEDIEFDPVAWCCEFSEYSSLAEAYKEYEDETASDEQMREYFQDHTTLIEVDDNTVIIAAF